MASSSRREQLEGRLAEIDNELSRPTALATERDRIEGELRALEAEEDAGHEFIFLGVLQKEGGRLKGNTLVEMPDGSFIELPHLMFEESVGDEEPPLTRSEFRQAEKEGRVLYGGRKNVVTLETAERLRAAGYEVQRRELPPQKTSRRYHSARV